MIPHIRRSLCALLIAGAALSLGSQLAAQTSVYANNWGNIAVGQSPVGQGFSDGKRKAPAGHNSEKDKAVINQDPDGRRYLTLQLHGYADNAEGKNPNHSPRIRYRGEPIALPAGEAITMSSYIRYVTPGAKRTGGYPTVAVFTDAGRFWYGFVGPNRLFINMGTNKQLIVTSKTNFDLNAWYHFKLEFSPKGDVTLTVSKMGADNSETEVWKASSAEAGYAPMSPTKVTYYMFEAIRPGKRDTDVSSTDFSDLFITAKP